MTNAFPVDEPLSRFLVSMAMARNDIENAMWKAAEANEADTPDFTYWVRLVMGHFLEAADALQRWRNESGEVRDFLDRLPTVGQQALGVVGGTLNKVGPEAVKHARNHSFHYPAPKADYDSDGELVKALTALAHEPVEIGEVPGRPGRPRYVFADKAALMVAMGKHTTEDPKAYRNQVEIFEDGAAQFVNFVHIAINKHLGCRRPSHPIQARRPRLQIDSRKRHGSSGWRPSASIKRPTSEWTIWREAGPSIAPPMATSMERAGCSYSGRDRYRRPRAPRHAHSPSLGRHSCAFRRDGCRPRAIQAHTEYYFSDVARTVGAEKRHGSRSGLVS